MSEVVNVVRRFRSIGPRPRLTTLDSSGTYWNGVAEETIGYLCIAGDVASVLGIDFVVTGSVLHSAGLAFPWAFIAAYEGGSATGGLVVFGFTWCVRGLKKALLIKRHVLKLEST